MDAKLPALFERELKRLGEKAIADFLAYKAPEQIRELGLYDDTADVDRDQEQKDHTKG